MITSALISQCRREYYDVPKSTRVQRTGDGASTLFNLGSFPVIESSYSIYKGTSAQTETTNYTLDKDSGDLTFVSAPTSAYTTKAEFKFANWRDTNWVEAINQAIISLNARGFYKQVVKDRTVLHLSANIRTYTGPSGCVDLYELLESDDYTLSGNFIKLGCNWSYQQEANKLTLGNWPSRANYLESSYLRKLYTYNASSATLDAPDMYLELVKKKAGSIFYWHMAGKVARSAHASIDEGHFSFSNLRAMAKELDDTFENESRRLKPTRPAKDIAYHIETGGNA